MIRPMLAAAFAVLALNAGPGVASAGFAEGAAAYQAGDFARAAAEWRPLAEAGDPVAQYNLGILYRQGDGVPADPAQALAWFRRAAAQGSALSMFNLGLMYGSGDGVPTDLPAARTWMARAERAAQDEGLRRDAAYLGGLLARQIGPEADAEALGRAGSAPDGPTPPAVATPAAAPVGAGPAEARPADARTAEPRPTDATAAAQPSAAAPAPPAMAPDAAAPAAGPATDTAGIGRTAPEPVAVPESAPESAPAVAARPAAAPGLPTVRPPLRPAVVPPPPPAIDRMREPRLTAAVRDGRIERPAPAGPAEPRLTAIRAEPPLAARRAEPPLASRLSGPAGPRPTPEGSDAAAAVPSAAVPSAAVPSAAVRPAAASRAVASPAAPPAAAAPAADAATGEIAALERVTPGGRGLTPPGGVSAPNPASGASAVRSVAPVAGGGFGVQVASLLSEADAAAQWRRLSAAHPELLGGLEPVVATGVVDGVTRYRLRLGPFDWAGAETLCRRLAARGGDCYAVPY